MNFSEVKFLRPINSNMQTSELGRLQVLAGIIDRYEQYVPVLPEATLTEEETALLESEWQKLEPQMLQEIDMPNNQQELQTGKRTLDILYKMLKAIMALVKVTGKVSRVFATGVWNSIRWLWRNKFAVAIVAALGIQYKWLVDGLDWVSDKLPDTMKGWMGLEDGESLGAMFGNWSEGTFKAGWDKVIELLQSYEGTNWQTNSIDAIGEIMAKVMELVGMATPVIVDLATTGVQFLMSDPLKLSMAGGVLSWLFIIGSALNMGDWIYKKASPMLDYVKGWFAKANIKDQVVKSVEDQISDKPSPSGTPSGNIARTINKA